MAKDFFTAEWFPYYFDRFNASGRVAKLSLAEEGAYHRAIRFAWEHGSVPSDPEELAAIIQKQCTVEIAEKLLKLFEVSPTVPSKAIHPTVEEIRREQEAKYLSSRERGLAGAEARWGKKKEVPPSEKPGKPPKPGGKDGSAIAKPLQESEKRTEKRNSESESFFSIDSYVHACVAAFADADQRLVEIAVLQAVMNRRGSTTEHQPIRSPAKYFKAEIEHMIAQGSRLGSTAIDAMLYQRRRQAGREVEAATA